MSDAPSRRIFLAAGSAATLMASLKAAVAADVSVDPVYAAIKEHQRLLDWANEPGAGDDETARRADIEQNYLYGVVVDTEPTTAIGACALLIHVAKAEAVFFNDDDAMSQAVRTASRALASLGGDAHV
jgi:hypothetical protein